MVMAQATTKRASDAVEGVRVPFSQQVTDTVDTPQSAAICALVFPLRPNARRMSAFIATGRILTPG
jgi:hypothetical protein